MTTITIETTNTNLSFLVSKNPQTQIDQGSPFTKHTNNLKTYCWFANSEGTKLVVHSKKVPNKRSDDFEYLDYSGYANPDNCLILLDNFLRKPLREKQELDVLPVTVKFKVFANEDLNILGLSQVYLNKNTKYCEVTITENSLHEALLKTQVFCYVQYTFSPDFYFIDDQYKKVIQLLVSMKPSYKVLNGVFGRINSKEKFNTIVGSFADSLDFTFNYGNNGQQRYNAIEKVLNSLLLSESVGFDLGAGEGAYSKLLAGKLSEVISIEKDEASFENLTHTIRKKELVNVKPHNIDIFETFNNPNFDYKDQIVLCTEVLEHMPYDDSVCLVKSLLSSGVSTAILTLPNKEFNKYYNLADDVLRLDDHDWEPTREVLQQFLDDCQITASGYKYTLTYIGNSVKVDPNLSSTFLITVYK